MRGFRRHGIARIDVKNRVASRFSQAQRREAGMRARKAAKWTSRDVEDVLEEIVLNRGGLRTDSFIQLSVKFQRARPIPKDGKSQALPTDLGQFPLRSVDDFAETAPTSWHKNRRGGSAVGSRRGALDLVLVTLPFRDKNRFREMPICFRVHRGVRTWEDIPRNYLVISEPSLEEDREVIRQFVNMPLRESSALRQQKSEDVDSESIQLQITPARAESYYRDEVFILRTIEDFFMRLIFGSMISKQLDEIKRRHERPNGLWHMKDNPFQETKWLTFDEATWPDIPHRSCLARQS